MSCRIVTYPSFFDRRERKDGPYDVMRLQESATRVVPLLRRARAQRTMVLA